MTTIAEKIEAAKAKIEKENARIKALEEQAARPSRRGERDVTEIRELMLVEVQFKKRYGVGFSGAAEITRKAKKEGIEPVVATGQNTEEQLVESSLPPAPPPLPQQHEEVVYDENDEPPVDEPPVAAQAEESEMPW